VAAGLRTIQPRRWWPAEHKAVATAAAALVLGATAVPTALLTDDGAHHPAVHPAAASSQHMPATGDGTPAELLSASASWSRQAQHSITRITAQLSMLRQAEQRLSSVPSTRRTRGMDLILNRVQLQIAKLGGNLTTLTDSVRVRSSYQHATSQLARVNVELGGPQGGQRELVPAAGASGVTTSLQADQRALSVQVGTWTAKLQHAVTQPVAAAPATPVTRLLGQVRGVLAPVAPVVAAPADALAAPGKPATSGQPAATAQAPSSDLPAAAESATSRTSASSPATRSTGSTSSSGYTPPAETQGATASSASPASAPHAAAPVEQDASAPASAAPASSAPATASPVSGNQAADMSSQINDALGLSSQIAAAAASASPDAAEAAKIVQQAEAVAKTAISDESRQASGTVPDSLGQLVQSASESGSGS
jgi:hypothetical protein